MTIDPHTKPLPKKTVWENTQTVSKSMVRTKSLRLRDALPEQERASYSRKIVKNLTSLTCYKEAGILLAYANYRSEVETTGLIVQALSEGRHVFVPKVTGREMEFYQITDLTRLHEGYRGIPEPEEGMSYPAYLAKMETLPRTLLCMPGAAFDMARHRIGYGGGFYDRYLDKIAAFQARDGLSLVTAALAYECQVWEEIPWEPHDITPDILLTERRLV